MGTSGDRFLQESPLMARKFRNMKILVLWLQEAKKFGRYCYYGCYCLPEGSHNIAMGGYGKPVDNIDRACFNFKQCYKCLLDEHADGQGLPKNTPKSPDCKYFFLKNRLLNGMFQMYFKMMVAAKEKIWVINSISS